MPESATASIKVLLVDDHALFRESVARLLEAEGGFKVIAHCGSVEEALPVLRQTYVDIVLLDFDLGDRNGTQFMRLARQEGFTGKVLVVTAGVAGSDAAELIRNGISGIFMKHDSAASLAQGVREVMSGKVYFDQQLLQGALIESEKSHAEAQEKRFTHRESQVLSYVFEGIGNKDIAERMGLSESTVKATLQQLFSKTGVRTRAQLVRIALEQYKNEL